MSGTIPRLVVSTLLLLAVSGACTGGGGGPDPAPGPLTGPGHSLPGLGGLPSGAGLPIRGASDAHYQLLDHAPVMTSPNESAMYWGGDMDLDPSKNDGFAWAVFELYDFPSDGSVRPLDITIEANQDCYLSVSNYSDGVWNHFLSAPMHTVSLGGAYRYHTDNGSMYVAVIVMDTALNFNSLRVRTSAQLENWPYDEHENNDNGGQANPLPAFPLSGWLGSLGPGGYDGDDKDYYAFAAAEGDALSLGLSYEPAAANIALTLFEAGSMTALLDDSDGNPGLRLANIGLKAGDYVLRARVQSGAGDYSLNATLTPLGLVEVEDNDSLAEANPLSALLGATGQVGDNSYDGDADDYFSFEAQEGDYALLTLNYSAGDGNIGLRLRDDGNHILDEDLDGNPGLRNLNWGLHAGTHYVQVLAQSGTAQYELSVNLSPGGYEEVEENDAYAAANPLPAPPVSNFTGSLGPGGYDGDNQDYFSFEATDGDVFIAELFYDSPTANFNLTLYDAAHSQLAQDTAGNDGSREIMLGLHSGVHYLVARAASGSGNYTLGLVKDHPGYDESEDNETPATADVLPAFPVAGWLGSLGAQGYDGDSQDYSTFSVGDKTEVYFSLDYDESAASAGFTLYDAGQQLIYADNLGNPGSRSFSWGLKAGSYYLKTTAASGAANYSLGLTSATLSLDESEDNDSRAGAQAVTLPLSGFSGHCGQFGYDGDGDDYFSFNLASALTVNATLAYSSADGTLKLYLLNSSGSVVDSDTAGNPGTRSVSAALSAGTAYLRAACTSGGSDYTLDVSTSP